MDCECLPACPFFNDKMATKPSLASLMKKQYCKGDFNSCARHQVFIALGKESVPNRPFSQSGGESPEVIQKNNSIQVPNYPGSFPH